MIVSHKHRFILLRTEKTGGTSIQSVLAQFCDPGDLITGIGGTPSRELGPEWTRYPILRRGWLRRTSPRLFSLHTHATARQVRAAIGRQTFDSYFKFTVERNPWDRQVSLYFQRRSRSGRDSASDFDRNMRSALFRHTHYTRLRNWDVYSIDGSVCVDRVLMYHNLEQELADVMKLLGLPQNVPLPAKRSGFRPGGRCYRDFYTDFTRDLIGRWYKREIDAFGFEF